MEEGGLRYEPLGDHHLPLCRHFRCGKEALDVYLRSRRAWQEQEQHLLAVRILYDPKRNRIAGYYTLSSFYINPAFLPEELRGRARYDVFPATLIGRLARDRDYAQRIIGGRLLLDAMKRSLRFPVRRFDYGGEAFFAPEPFVRLNSPESDRQIPCNMPR